MNFKLVFIPHEEVINIFKMNFKFRHAYFKGFNTKKLNVVNILHEV